MVRFLVAEGAATCHKVKCPGMLLNGVILLHDNTRPNIANVVRDKLKRFGWETLQHLPYVSDISAFLVT